MDRNLTSLHVRLGLKYPYPVGMLSNFLNDENQKFFTVFPLMRFFVYLLICISVGKLNLL